MSKACEGQRAKGCREPAGLSLESQGGRREGGQEWRLLLGPWGPVQGVLRILHFIPMVTGLPHRRCHRVLRARREGEPGASRLGLRELQAGLPGSTTAPQQPWAPETFRGGTRLPQAGRLRRALAWWVVEARAWALAVSFRLPAQLRLCSAVQPVAWLLTLSES